jgi:hypothetical protein
MNQLVWVAERLAVDVNSISAIYVNNGQAEVYIRSADKPFLIDDEESIKKLLSIMHISPESTYVETDKHNFRLMLRKLEEAVSANTVHTIYINAKRDMANTDKYFYSILIRKTDGGGV